mgnify:CR=1 FL=1
MKIIISLLFALLAAFPQLSMARSIEVEVNGLVCAFCAQGIKKSLGKFPEAEEVFVSLENRLVAVQLKEGSDIADADLKKAITDAGYATVGIARTEQDIEAIRARVEQEQK